MRQLTELEIQKAAMLKAARAAIRLKHALEADAEIARRLPELEAEIDNALAEGRPMELEPGHVFIVDEA